MKFRERGEEEELGAVSEGTEILIHTCRQKCVIPPVLLRVSQPLPVRLAGTRL